MSAPEVQATRQHVDKSQSLASCTCVGSDLSLALDQLGFQKVMESVMGRVTGES